MTYDELDQILEDYSDSTKSLADFDVKPSADFDPTQLTDSMSAFINKQSNILSGAKLPNRWVKAFLPVWSKMVIYLYCAVEPDLNQLSDLLYSPLLHLLFDDLVDLSDTRRQAWSVCLLLKLVA